MPLLGLLEFFSNHTPQCPHLRRKVGLAFHLRHSCPRFHCSMLHKIYSYLFIARQIHKCKEFEFSTRNSQHHFIRFMITDQPLEPTKQLVDQHSSCLAALEVDLCLFFELSVAGFKLLDEGLSLPQLLCCETLFPHSTPYGKLPVIPVSL